MIRLRNICLLRPFFVILLLCYSAMSLAANRIELTGVTLERKDNVELYLSSIDPSQINKSARFKSRVNRDIKQALRGLGYYQVIVNFEDQQEGDDYVLLAKITANKYVFIQVNDLAMYGDAVRDAEFRALQKKMAPRKGERMHHGKYEAYKKALLSLAHRKGYFDAKFTKTELIVTPGKRQGIMRLHFDSGVRYKIGEISFQGSQIREARLRTLMPFKSGDYYSAESLGKLNQALATTLWFSSINLDADPDRRKDGLLPLRVELEPAMKNIVETGIGYSTDVEGRFKTKWERPWVNDRGHSMSADLELSNPEQLFEGRYKLPQRNVSHDYYQILLGYKHRDVNDIDSRLLNLGVERQWLLDNGWYRNVSMRWLYQNYLQAGKNDKSNLLLPGISFYKNTDGGSSMPMQADNYLIGVEVANQAWAADTDFIRLRGRAGWIGSWNEDQRWLVRMDAGLILQEEVSNIPPSLRFFAGGDNSLRGYKFESIAPVDAENVLIGGTKMATANMEYQHRVHGDFWLAAFSDYGSAWNDQPDWKKSVGLGLRWASPVGPIRLDLAYALDHEPDGKFRFHFTLGPEL
jgi:translocation and assembly module TamA